jgi:hypothetical protein
MNGPTGPQGPQTAAEFDALYRAKYGEREPAPVAPPSPLVSPTAVQQPPPVAAVGAPTHTAISSGCMIGRHPIGPDHEVACAECLDAMMELRAVAAKSWESN